jgi:hypothetical protein
MYDRLVRKEIPMVIEDVRYLPSLKPGGYGFPARISTLARESIKNRKVDRQVFEAIDRGVKPAARQKMINLIKKVRKRTGKTYYQRAQTSQLQQTANESLTAKKYIKGVDFSYRKIS